MRRWLPIDDSWCFEVLAARIAAIARKHPDDWEQRTIAQHPNGGDPTGAGGWQRAAAATSRTITVALKNAGLKVDGQTVSPPSSNMSRPACSPRPAASSRLRCAWGCPNLDDAAHLRLRLEDRHSQPAYTQPGPGEGCAMTHRPVWRGPRRSPNSSPS